MIYKNMTISSSATARHLLCCLAILMLLITPMCNADTFVPSSIEFANHSFEQPEIPGIYLELPEEITGWNAISGLNTFNIHGSIWASQDGNQHIEFDNRGASIQQTVSGFYSGKTYKVIFAMTGNPDADFIYSLRLDILNDSNIIATDNYQVDSRGVTRQSLVWYDMELPFTANANTLTFKFTRTDNNANGWGPDLDNVRIQIKASADINNDCAIDQSDLLIMAQQWLATPNDVPALVADLNEDKIVNLIDFSILAWQWHTIPESCLPTE